MKGAPAVSSSTEACPKPLQNPLTTTESAGTPMKTTAQLVTAAALGVASMNAAAWWAAPSYGPIYAAPYAVPSPERVHEHAERERAAIERMMDAHRSALESRLPAAPFERPEPPAFGERPQIPEMPEIPPFGARPQPPEMPSFSDFPELPELPARPEPPEFGDRPAMPEPLPMPKLGGYPQMPEMDARLEERRARIAEQRKKAQEQAAERRAAMREQAERRRTMADTRRMHHRGPWAGPMPLGYGPMQPGCAPAEDAAPQTEPAEASTETAPRSSAQSG